MTDSDRPSGRSLVGTTARLALVLATATSAVACDDESSAAAVPPVIATIVAGRHAPATDQIEVWVCHVPDDVADPLYAVTDRRPMLDADFIVDRIGADVGAYWAAVSHGAYRPTFHAGGSVQIGATETSEQCIERALARSSGRAEAVLVVADAQHADDQPGGRSTPGSWLSCTAVCSAAETGRYVYIGANDFSGAIDAPLPLDLIEHEMGHSLGLPHSGDVVGAAGNQGAGPYDVMADPASPRAVDSSRRDAPDLLAIDRLDLGWMSMGDVWVADSAGEPVTLAASTGPTGTRLLVVPLDDHRALTVELLVDSGYDDHLPTSGVVVHLVDDSPAQCGATTRCTDLERVQQIVAADSGDRTLLRAGDTVTVSGATISVDSIDAGEATVTAAT